MNFNLGERALVTGQFNKVSDNSLVDPAVVRVKVQNPLGQRTTYTYTVGITVVRLSLGVYQISVLLNIPGGWIVRFEGNSDNEAADDTTLFADGSVFYGSSGNELPDS